MATKLTRQETQSAGHRSQQQRKLGLLSQALYRQRRWVNRVYFGDFLRLSLLFYITATAHILQCPSKAPKLRCSIKLLGYRQLRLYSATTNIGPIGFVADEYWRNRPSGLEACSRQCADRSPTATSNQHRTPTHQNRAVHVCRH